MLLELEANKLSPKRISVSEGLKIFCLYISLLKYHEIRIFVNENKPQILCLNETKIDSSIADDDIELKDYVVNREDRNCPSGDLAVYVHKSSKFKVYVDLRMIELETITVALSIPFVNPIVLTTIYQPDGPVEVFDEIEPMISKIKSEKKEFVLLGGLNCVTCCQRRLAKLST